MKKFILLLAITAALSGAAFSQGGPNANMGASSYSGGIAPSMSDNEALRRILYGQQHAPAGGALTDAQLRASAVPVSVASLPSHAVTNAGTFAVQNTAALPAGSALIGKVGVDQTTPGSTNAVQAKQYTGVPSTFTPASADATVFTLAAGEKGFIQNLSADAPLAVKKGASASTSSFSFILPAGVATDDGKGGAIVIDDWVGVVSVAKISGTARYIAWKKAP